MTQTDVLGEPYLSESLALADDDEGSVVATLVRRPADKGPAVGAVLHVHGFCDYFFQTPLAEFYTGLGYDFYGLDLRKYGRSLLPHQTPNFCRDLNEYDAELDESLRLIRERDGHQRVLISGHSTGGLITSLWASRRHRGGSTVADAFVFNSPWLDLHGSLLARTAGTRLLNELGKRWPYRVIPRTVTGVYAETLHKDFRGEWDFNLAWKPRESFPVYAGWLRAIRLGHGTVHEGIDVGAPVLTLCSTRSTFVREWSEIATRADTVLDVKQIAEWSRQLSRDVTVVRVPDAIHDVFLSRKEVRDSAFEAVHRWLTYALR